MASSTKKSTTKSQKKPAAKSGGSRAKTSTASKKSEPARRPVRREVGSGVCALLGLCTLFSLFGQDAPVLNWLWSFFRGLFGWGMWLLPLALFAAAAILLFHRGRPVRLRVTCALVCVPLCGAIAHLFGDANTYAFGWGMFGELYRAGAEQALCGGIVGGLLAWGMESGLGTALSAAILILALIASICVAASRQIEAIAKRISERERVEYEPEPEREPKPAKVRAEKPSAPEVAPEAAVAAPEPERPSYDVPPPAEESHRETRRERREKKKLLRERAAGVVSPDELVGGEGQGASAPDVGRLPNEVPPPDDPVPPLVLEEELVDEISGAVERAVESEIAPFERESAASAVPNASAASTGSAAHTASDVQTSAVQPPREEPKPTLRPAAPEPKIVDTLGAKSEQSERERAAAEVAAELGRSVESEQGGYVYPSTELLNPAPPVVAEDATNEMKQNAARLSETLQSFGIEAKIINVTRGPSVTRYELELDRGVKLAKISGLADDIALSLGSSGVRIAPIPDKSSVVGIEVPNKTVATVSLREIIESREFAASKSPVAFAVGRDISGTAVVGNIEKLPHMLIAGTTGSGKSVCMNSLIISLLYKSSPDKVRLIMVDPKMIELNVYNGIPHLLIPVVTDPKKAAGALQWAVGEMMNRYAKFRDAAVRNIDEYNAYAERTEGVKSMPQVVILIDELADLMLVAAKEVEESICRIAQMARAAGMHLVIATQSPRADVITGLMKANIPSRIAFAVASSLESRIIMDTPGAEKLVGRGDMLYFPLGSRKATRIQGCFVSSAEVERVVEFVKKSGETSYSEEVLSQIERAAQEGGDGSGAPADGADDCDEMLPQAVEVLLETGQASVSMLQRRLKLGYARAARLVDQLERRGIVGPFEGAKPRQLLITREQWEEMKLQNPEYQ